MKILFDHQIFQLQKYGGISRYYYELLKQLNKIDGIDFDLALKYTNNFYLLRDSELFNIMKDNLSETFCFGLQFIGKAKLHRILAHCLLTEHPFFENRKISERLLKNNRFEIFHTTYYDNYFIKYLNKKPFVVTVYDMIHELFSEYHFKKSGNLIKRKRELISKASHIITISENTKADIIKFYNVDERKISVVYLGNSFPFTSLNKKTIFLPERFILYVGDRRLYKNFDFFIQSITSLLLKDEDIFLVCAGSINFTNKEKAMIERHGLIKKIIHFPFVDDEMLIELYREALCFVFPTLYEGFGLPVLESFSCGCPAVLSKNSSLPEVGGGAAQYFDPEDSESILETIKKVVYNEALMKTMVVEGYKQLEKFSWEKCAIETKKVYEKILV